MVQISQRMSQISESQTLALSGLMARLKREGKDVVALGAGEPDFDTPQHIKEAAIAAIQKGFTKYTAAEGTAELREAICRWLLEEYQAEYKPSQIVVTCGAKHAVYQAILAVCNPGDEVLLPAPYWVSYPEQIKLAGATIKFMETNERSNLKISAAQLKDAITSRTKLLILNSPSNPSGAVYDARELSSLAEVIHDSGIMVLSDEIYDKIVFDDAQFASIAQFPEIRDQLLLVNGVSKTFAMTGWRIGFLAAHQDVANAVKNYQGHSTSNPTSISQSAALTAMLGQKQFIADMRAAFTERRNYVHHRLCAMPNVRCLLPQGAFYAFPNISAYFGKRKGDRLIQSSVDLCGYLLQDFGVAIVPGSAFGMDSHARLSFATSMAVLEKALDRIENGLKSLL